MAEKSLGGKKAGEHASEPYKCRERRRLKAHTSEFAPALRMRAVVSAPRERAASAKGGGLLGPPPSCDREAEESPSSGTAARLNSTMRRAGALLPLLLCVVRQCQAEAYRQRVRESMRKPSSGAPLN